MRINSWLAIAAICLTGVLSAQDASDAPAPYPTFTVFMPNGGTRLDYLGNGCSDDTSPYSGWTADTEDDGLEFFNMVKGQTATIKVAVVVTNANSDLCIWMDFNNDGDWADAGERVVWAGKSPSAPQGAFQPRVAPPYGGSSTSFNTYSVSIPSTAVGTSVKVRALVWDVTGHPTGPMALNGGGHPGGATGYGYTDFGEVEDHDVPYGTDTGAKFQVAEYDGWGTVGNMIANNGTQNVGSLTAGYQANLYWLLGNEATASCFVRFTNAYPNATITHSNAQNCSVSLFTPGNGVTLSPGTLGFSTIAMVTPTTSAPFSFRMHVPTNDPQEPTFSWTVQGNGSAPAPMIEIHRPTYTVMASGSTHDYGTRDAGIAFSGGFTIFNNGTAQLDFTGNPMIAISAVSNCTASFAQPTQNYLPSGGWSYGVQVDVTPMTAGSTFGFTMTVASNDPVNGSYVVNFTGDAVTSGGGGGGGGGGGTGTPTIQVSRGGILPSGAGDNLGTLVIGGSTSYVYTVTNTGTAPLSFTGSPRVSISNLNNCAVTVVQQLPAGLAAGMSATFILAVTTQNSGGLGFTVTVTCDDPVTPNYTLGASATVAGNGGGFDIGSAKGGSGGAGCAGTQHTNLTILAMMIALGVLAWRRTRSLRREKA